MGFNEEWADNVKKHLERGDIGEVAHDLQVSQAYVSMVLRGKKHSLSVTQALIRKAEERKNQKENLLNRASVL